MILLFDFDTTLNSSLYFKMGVLLILAGIFLGGVYWRNKMKSRRILREQQLREEEQNRIRRKTAEDFHDEIGNRLTRIKLLASVAEQKILISPEEIPELLNQIKENASELYSSAKDIIWALQPESDFLKAIILRIHQNAIAVFEYSGINFSFHQSENISDTLKLPSDCGRNLMMIFKEANYNVLKHAGAKNVSMSVELSERELKITLSDDGNGFQKNHSANPIQNGIHNMKRRAERIGATFEISSTENNSGTFIALNLPV